MNKISKVTVLGELVTIPVYDAYKPDKTRFFEKRVYQGGMGKVYPMR